MTNPRPLPLGEALLRAAVPLAALVAIAVFAAREPAPAGAEGIYLAVLAGAALLAVAFLAPAPAVELGAGAVLVVTAAWALPAGPGRGAAVTLLLTALLAIAAARRLAACLPELPLDVAVPLALGAQVLLRGDLLFHPQANVRTLVALLALPMAGAVAAALLARRHGGGPTLLAAATALLLAPGWNVAATLGLIALAAGDQLARPDLGRMGKGVALLVLVAPIAWEPGPGLAAAVAGLCVAGMASRKEPSPPVPLSRHPTRPPRERGDATEPASHDLGKNDRRGSPSPGEGAGSGGRGGQGVRAFDRSWGVAIALVLAAVTPRIPDASALAAPLALAALSMRREGPAPTVQAVWTGALLGGTALLASYPWLRENPLVSALALVGLPLGWRSGAAVVGAFVVLVVLLGRLRAVLPRGVGGEALAAASAIFLALLLHLPGTGTPLLPPETGVTLEPARPAWLAGFAAARPVGGVMVESSLSGGAGLANGTPVATVRLRDEGGRSVLWILRAGEGTGEWAARRPDVERSSLLKSPPAWMSWVAGDFFGQRYRAAWTLTKAERFTHLRIELARGLPPEVGLTLHQVEVRR